MLLSSAFFVVLTVAYKTQALWLGEYHAMEADSNQRSKRSVHNSRIRFHASSPTAVDRRRRDTLTLGGPKRFHASNPTAVDRRRRDTLTLEGPKRFHFAVPSTRKRRSVVRHSHNRVHMRHTRAAAEIPKGSPKLWTSPIYYEIKDDFKEETRQVMREAMEYIEANSCLKYQEFDSSMSEDTDRLVFRKGERCTSLFGKIGGAQDLLISEDPSEGCISLAMFAHELFHALGLQHEIKREDRNTWLKVLEGNVADEQQFSIEHKIYGLHTYPFDIDSLMQYDNEFLRNGENKITYQVKIPGTEYWTRREVKTYAKPTFLDMAMVNDLYSCTDKCVEQGSNPSCQNDGFVGGSDCRCICPRGLSGDHCENREHDCGETLSDSTGVIETSTFSDSVFSNDMQDKKCSWLIPAKEDEIVHLSFYDLFNVEGGDKCVHNYAELRVFGISVPGLRLCGPQDYTKMAYTVPAATYLELGIKDSNGYRIGFKATYQILKKEAYDKCDKVCFNGGMLNVDSCSCDCKEHFEGDKCENFKNQKCAANVPCENGGILNVADPDCRCECPKEKGMQVDLIGPRCQYFGYCHQRLDPALVQVLAPPAVRDDAQCQDTCDGSLATLLKCPLKCSTKCLCNDFSKSNPKMPMECSDMQNAFNTQAAGSGDCKKDSAMNVYCQKFCDMCPAGSQ